MGVSSTVQGTLYGRLLISLSSRPLLTPQELKIYEIMDQVTDQEGQSMSYRALPPCYVTLTVSTGMQRTDNCHLEG